MTPEQTRPLVVGREASAVRSRSRFVAAVDRPFAHDVEYRTSILLPAICPRRHRCALAAARVRSGDEQDGTVLAQPARLAAADARPFQAMPVEPVRAAAVYTEVVRVGIDINLASLLGRRPRR
jgi:hypothetical protein